LAGKKTKYYVLLHQRMPSRAYRRSQRGLQPSPTAKLCYSPAQIDDLREGKII